jgi:hypothetical protein
MPNSGGGIPPTAGARAVWKQRRPAQQLCDLPPFFSPNAARPQAELLQDALRQLYVLDAIDVNGQITRGRRGGSGAATAAAWCAGVLAGQRVVPGAPMMLGLLPAGCLDGGSISTRVMVFPRCMGASKGRAMALLPLDPSRSRALLAARSCGACRRCVCVLGGGCGVWAAEGRGCREQGRHLLVVNGCSGRRDHPSQPRRRACVLNRQLAGSLPVAEASLRALTRWPVCCSGGKTGQPAVAAAEAQAARQAAQEQHASAAERRNTNDAASPTEGG